MADIDLRDSADDTDFDLLGSLREVALGCANLQCLMASGDANAPTTVGGRASRAPVSVRTG